jgi:ABC-type multidrug transport system fused ATPase/permease subunit
LSDAATLLDTLPLGFVAVGLVALFVVAAELGYAAHKRFGRSGNRAADRDASDETQVLATALLLLALLLGFTFSMALSRYDTRRDEIVKEANDIGTAWLRAGLAGNPAGTALQARLADYAATRVNRADAHDEADDDRAADREMRRKGAQLRREIWSLAAAATLPDRSTAQSAALIAAVNAVLDRATTREAAIDARVPSQVILLLIGYATIAALLLGYVLGAFGSHHRLATTVLFVLLATTIMLIMDLDRPQDGAIRVSQQPMLDLVAEIAAR